MPSVTTLPADLLHMHESTTGNADASGAGETRTYMLSWSELYSFLDQVAGMTVTVVGSGTSTVVFTSPMQHPVKKQWYATSARWEGYGSSGDGGAAGIVYDKARLWITFSTLPYNFDSSEVYAATLKSSAEIVTIPGYNLFFPDGTRVYEDMPIPIARASIQVTRYRIANPDAFNLDAIPLTNRANSEAFAIYGLPAGSVMLDSASTSLSQTWGGVNTSVASMSFEYREALWGSKWNPASGAFEMVHVGSSSGPFVIPRNDINVLLTNPY